MGNQFVNRFEQPYRVATRFQALNISGSMSFRKYGIDISGQSSVCPFAVIPNGLENRAESSASPSDSTTPDWCCLGKILPIQ